MKVLRCARCGRRYRGSGDWNVTAQAGRIVGVLCPDCQTPDENAEAAINEATSDYIEDERGRFWARPKQP